ncbi:hypothetical protein M2475_000950 [Breznakia sp. PF5-3]|uniref:hypothetical protein n=1 Tax=unclassified Breznakia TaxID=2623764 RepID=UPI002406DA37|nr:MULTISPECIES: hypothetical protein [unclassified Breznakia]MDF9824722.1 hypothetical protein [Breznakia sp. PM6-1]MDF9835385.1 hypothetical protein [Breznakia sp. PF5-3]MDF9836984.1 hypothetical protein [Breznakia sp. PFB2-8]MDF9859620.1 hypothetical protein [Breznakia sp. PH5-24]
MLKLLKHEFKVNRTSFLALYLVVIGLSIILRLSNFTNITDDTASIFIGLLMMLYVFGILAAYIYVFVAVIRSFNKSMFKKSGYLTMTLPVSTTSKIISKMLMASFWFIVSTIVIILSLMILIPDFVNAFSELGDILAHYGFNITLWLLLVLAVVSVFQSILSMYLCVTFVNTKYVKGHRLLIGIGVYFVFSYLTNYIQLLFLNTAPIDALNMMEPKNYPSVELYLNDFSNELNNLLSSVIVPNIIISVIFGLLCFFAIKYLIEKKIELD